MARERLMVMSPAPTANGDLHLGHVAGPFLAADVCTRYARATGHDAMFGTGMHFTQNYIVTAARRLGTSPEELRLRSADEVAATLAALGIGVDAFGCVDDRFVKMVLNFYDRLHRDGKLRLKAVPFPYLPSTGEYLTDSYVRGGCPYCLADGCAGLCENCAHPVLPGELIDPRSTADPAAPVELRDVDVLVLPLEEYREELVAYFDRIRPTMRPRLARLIDDMLSRPLADFPVTQPISWGIPAPFAETPGQVIYADLEGMPWSMYCTATAAESRGAVLGDDDELWHADSGTRVVYFLGLDASFPFAVVGVAMLLAHGGYLLPEQWITNEFYELDNEKFSTSRGHVVSGRELAAEVPRDLIRFYLSATGPEFQRTNFTRAALTKVAGTRLVEPWNRVVSKVDEIVGLGALPVSERSRSAAGRMVAQFTAAFELPGFSLAAAAFALVEQLARLDRWPVGSDDAGDFCHEVEVFLRCAAPILIDLAAKALPDTAIPLRPDAVEVVPARLPRLTGAGS
ncbi:class I tRNA ligase family protein [Kutzneria buriramensis]|uniref:Methionyl-tRNA synthetase n=1 Tax=Kutzneria buriramensis TaxID=1045776 RepID=A0A3E0HHQ4_9PSEU|nr:class I tRNA ligase family protein [Kutzneria buriramensis]REH46014.1 methionyl-tRNA synthetase [Kutzneria buriramensis]